MYIVGDNQEPYAQLMLEDPEKRFIGTRSIEKADIVLFTGGPDIDPTLYAEKPLSTTHVSASRDAVDLEAWAVSEDKLKVGICRGAQFLNVMCGGALWQDVDNHTKDHSIHERLTGARLWVTSAHHQMMIPNSSARIIATAAEAYTKRGYGKSWTRRTPDFNPSVVKFDDDRADVEVCAYDQQKVLCFQPHPELGRATRALRLFFFNQIGVCLLRTGMKK